MPEPILWADKVRRKVQARAWNPETRQMEPVYDPDTGQPVMERIPQTAHEGHSDPRNPQRVRHARSVRVLKHDGHVIDLVLNNAAADVNFDSPWTRERKAKMRHFGWIPFGECPLARVQAGELRLQQIQNLDVRGAQQPCSHGTYGPNAPCPHYLAEEKTRKEKHGQIQAKRDAQFKSEADKILEGQKEHATDMAATVAREVTKALAELRGDGGKWQKK